MSDSQSNLVLDLLRAMRGDLSEIKTDLTELKQRVGLMEAQYANLSNRIAGDVSLIKRRLDLVDA